MTARIATQEPGRLVAGDSWSWSKSLADYPAPTWTLTYQFVSRDARFAITATADGSDHKVAVAPTVSKDFAPDRYLWEAYVTDGADRHRVGFGELEVLPDFERQAAGYDGRSHAERTLEAIEAVIEKRATKDQMSYAIEDRRLDRTPIADLLKFRDRYRAEVQSEKTSKRLAAGKGSGRMVLTRFGR